MDTIVIRGARENNLKNIDLELPRDRLIVVSGLSGSGKSSLAFDTIFAEGQRRYVESLSSYARQFLGRLDKPDLDYIEGLSPAISIEQKTTARNPRSTVGTVTEIYDYLRLLYARVGHAHCPDCGQSIQEQSVDTIIDAVLSHPDGTRISLLAPVVRDRKGEHQKVLEDARRAGFVRVRVGGEVKSLDGDIKLDKRRKHTIEIVVDRVRISSEVRRRLAESVETTLNVGAGRLIAVVQNGKKGTEEFYSQHAACSNCGFSMPELQPRLFSFNSPHGACPNCSGLGVTLEFDPEKVLPDMSLSFNQGGIAAYNPKANWYRSHIAAVADHFGFSLDTPLSELPENVLQVILNGTTDRIAYTYVNAKGGKWEYSSGFPGVLKELRRRYLDSSSEGVKEWLETFMSQRECPECKGKRLRKEALAVTLADRNIYEVSRLSVLEAIAFFESLPLTDTESQIAAQILKEVVERLGFMRNVGLDYLALDRKAATLSGGEAQRIRLATQIGSQLVGVLYILDEPTIGLHQRDNQRLLETLLHLRDIGNTLIVVEHDEQTLRCADHIVDLGPGAGVHGGEIVAQGSLEDVIAQPLSLTGQYLSGALRIDVPEQRRTGNGGQITVTGAREHNLKGIDVSFPLGTFTVITGVSGSGKSTLLTDLLYPILANGVRRGRLSEGDYDRATGVGLIDKVINIDQSPIGRTPRSNPATYVGLFAHIRELFASLPESKSRGYKPGRFSFNVKGGRCENCQGDGTIKIEMHFLPDVYITCDVCHGHRYNRETLEIRYRGKNIHEVLELSIEEALEFFSKIPKVRGKLETLSAVGLDYVKLGQSALTLSGGEAQRVKLALELSKRSTGRTFYILDEPTTGLHFADVKLLMEVLQRLVDLGNTVVAIEHNLDVIKQADHVIDLGPEGGDRGGQVIGVGTPEEIAGISKSHTGRYLAESLALVPSRELVDSMPSRFAAILLIVAFVVTGVAFRAEVQELIFSTMAQDIDSADYYELVAWAERLGLPSTGNRTELQRRLYAYYQVPIPETEDEMPAQSIVIQSARGSEYFTLEGAEEDYLILQGDVRVEFRDNERGVVHRVQAQRIVVNQTRRMLTASDSVTYELIREVGKPEIFRGESFSFDMEEWNGLIYDGRGETEREISDGELVSFVFAGRNIIRRDDETVILQEGTVTTSVAEDPYWRIQADRIWVLGPGEWATRKAFLYVGRVPLFYLPFFFKPGDQLVFHPAVGYRTREGNFIQTTTYLVGEQAPEPSTFSFLRLTDEQSDRYRTEREGLYLTKVESDEAQEETGTLKIMLDYYSRLGLFTGAVADFDPVFDITGGLALSRTLYQSASGVQFTPFNPGSTVPLVPPATRSDWNSTEIAGVEIPFRFGFEGNVRVSEDLGTISAGLEYFSDPFVPEDFYERRERFNVTTLLSGTEGEDEEGTQSSGLDATKRSNITWDLSATGKLEPEWDLLDTVSLSKFDLGLFWQGKELAPADPGPDGDFRPSREFFSPTRLVAPDARLRFSGELYRWVAGLGDAPEPDSEKVEAEQRGVRPPGGESGDAEELEEEELRLPPPLDDLPGLDLDRDPASLTISYETEPKILIENQFNDADWNRPGAVDFEYRYSLLDLSGNHTFRALATAWDARLTTDLAFGIDGLYRYRYNRGPDVTDWDSLTDSDRDANKLDLSQTTDVSLFPLANLRTLSTSKFFYSLNWDFVQQRHEDPNYLVWKEETVIRHEVGERLVYKPGLTENFLEVTADLPPLDDKYLGEADFTWKFFRTNVTGGIRDDDLTGWTYEDLVATETVTPADWVKFVDKTTFDLNSETMRESQATLNLFELSSAAGGYILEQRVDWQSTWDRVSLVKTTASAFGLTAYYQAERRIAEIVNVDRWEPEPGIPAQLIPSRLNFSYSSLPWTLYLWRNRISVEPTAVTTLDFDLVRYTNSALDTTFALNFGIHKFLDVKLSATSYNNRVYRYVPDWADVVGGEWINPFQDLMDSFDFLGTDRREESAFNLRRFSIEAVHDLGDWQLSVDYSGEQELVENQYVFTPTFTIVVEWLPIPEIRRVIKEEDGVLSTRETP